MLESKAPASGIYQSASEIYKYIRVILRKSRWGEIYQSSDLEIQKNKKLRVF